MTTAWFGSYILKQGVSLRMRQHRAEDSIVQSVYQVDAPELASKYRGCLIGCTLPKQSNQDVVRWHKEVAKLYGIPEPIGHLLDSIFESLPTANCAQFAVDSIEAIPVGADLTAVVSDFILDMLTDKEFGVLRVTGQAPMQRDAVEAVIRLYRREAAGVGVTVEEWEAAAAAADKVQRTDNKPAAYAALAAEYAAIFTTTDSGHDAVDVAGYIASAHVLSTSEHYSAEAAEEWWLWAAARLLTHLRNAPVRMAVA